MGVFAFISYILVAIVFITLLWPVNVPLLALAYKVRLGTDPIPLEPKAFWLRTTFAALALAVLSLVLLLLHLILVGAARFPAGPVQLVLLMAYIPVGVWLMFWLFAMEDLLQGLGVFLLYLFLPGIPLLLVNWLFSSGKLLASVAHWARLAT